MEGSDKTTTIARNRKARKDYQIESTIEVGIELIGSEVKSLRLGKITISDAYAAVIDGELMLKNLHISPYEMAHDDSLDPLRTRRLLAHKREIRKLFVQTEQKGMTLIPLTIYFKGKVAKIELAIAVGRRKYDKRQAIAEADADRRMKQALKRDQ
jgi:SsrA-binding protein